MKKLALLGICTLFVAACGGGNNSSTPQPAGGTYNGPLVTPTFEIRTSSSGTSGSIHPSYVPTSTASVNVTLNTVNGLAPPGGLTTSVTTNISGSACTSGCAVNGPAVPPGTDNFTITTYDAAGATGSQLSVKTQSFTVTAGQANPLSITLLGIPKTFTISSVPSGTAGTAFGSAATLGLAVKDADGNTITGTYSQSVTLADSDTSSLTRATWLILNSGSAASSINSTASTDVIKFNYGGQAIAPATLTASATGATNGTATFTPTLSAIIPTLTEIDFYTSSGTGSTGTFTVSETGWSNSPYNQNFNIVLASGCSTIGALSGSSSATSFTINVAGSPAVGSCLATLTDGAGQSATVTLTYTTSGFTVNAHPHRK
jgi:hypothetical protein